MHHAARAGLHEGFPRAQGVFCSRKVGFLEGCCGGEGGIGEGEKFVNEPFFYSSKASSYRRFKSVQRMLAHACLHEVFPRAQGASSARKGGGVGEGGERRTR